MNVIIILTFNFLLYYEAHIFINLIFNILAWNKMRFDIIIPPSVFSEKTRVETVSSTGIWLINLQWRIYLIKSKTELSVVDVIFFCVHYFGGNILWEGEDPFEIEIDLKTISVNYIWKMMIDWVIRCLSLIGKMRHVKKILDFEQKGLDIKLGNLFSKSYLEIRDFFIIWLVREVKTKYTWDLYIKCT